jgi:hypothetical protein
MITMDDMIERISILEADVSAIKTDVSVLKKNVETLNINVEVILASYSTKADVSALETSLLKWGFGGMATFAAIIIAAVKFIH